MANLPIAMAPTAKAPKAIAPRASAPNPTTAGRGLRSVVMAELRAPVKTGEML
jgi:hypothetical protein